MDKIFFDMDGTLNYFEKGADLEIVSSKGYMRDRVPIANMIKAASIIAESGILDCFVASSVLPVSHAVSDKNYWCDKHIPFIDEDHRIYIPYGENKADYLPISGGVDVFLDDYSRNLREIAESRRNMLCVKVVNDINDTHMSWKGARVDIRSEPEVIAGSILRLYDGRRSRKRVRYPVLVDSVLISA